jgi:hypothetical protein
MFISAVVLALSQEDKRVGICGSNKHTKVPHQLGKQFVAQKREIASLCVGVVTHNNTCPIMYGLVVFERSTQGKNNNIPARMS